METHKPTSQQVDVQFFFFFSFCLFFELFWITWTMFSIALNTNEATSNESETQYSKKNSNGRGREIYLDVGNF